MRFHFLPPLSRSARPRCPNPPEPHGAASPGATACRRSFSASFTRSRRRACPAVSRRVTLAHGDEGPAEAHGRDARVLYRGRQHDARQTLLMELTLEGVQSLLFGADAGGAYVVADGAVVRDGAVADDDVGPGVAQLQPQQPVAA